jgi:Spherulation-specific family 4
MSLKTLKGRSRKCKIFTAAGVLGVIVFASLLGWGIPRALRKNGQSNDTVAVILSLYIYPNEGAWTPLYDAYPLGLGKLTFRVDKYPSLPFYVIINPDTGPGNNTVLDPNYARELPRLNSKKNVQTIGYVRTTWASRNISDVLRDVNTYSSWADNKTADYKVHGIFYDETPNAYSPDIATFMNTIDQHAKTQTGFGGINFVHP